MNQKKKAEVVRYETFLKNLATNFVESGHVDVSPNESSFLLIPENRWMPGGVIDGLHVIFSEILQELKDLQAFFKHTKRVSFPSERSLQDLYFCDSFDSDFGASTPETELDLQSELYLRLNKIFMLMKQDLGKRAYLKLETRKIGVLIKQLENSKGSLEALIERQKKKLDNLLANVKGHH